MSCFVRTSLWSAILLGLVAGCTTVEEEKMATVTGSVSYLQRIALPPDAVLEVKLVEVSNGATGRSIVEKTFAVPGQVPITYSLAYPPGDVRPDRQYGVQARILGRGKPLFVTQTVNHRMHQGRIVHADIILQPAK